MHKDVIPANHVIIGTCIRCGGPVTSPAEWPETAGGPPRHCQRCGAAQVGYGPGSKLPTPRIIPINRRIPSKPGNGRARLIPKSSNVRHLSAPPQTHAIRSFAAIPPLAHT